MKTLCLLELGSQSQLVPAIIAWVLTGVRIKSIIHRTGQETSINVLKSACATHQGVLFASSDVLSSVLQPAVCPEAGRYRPHQRAPVSLFSSVFDQ